MTSGTFAASSPSGAVLTYGISGGAATNTVLGGVAYDVSGNSPYGTLFVNSTTGAYAFVPNNDAINALTAPTTDPFTITVSDGTLSASQTFTITINGTNDAAIISGTVAGLVIEAGGVANAVLDTPTVTGTLTDTDVDNTPNTFTAVSSPTASAGGYGTFTMTKAGAWTYTLNEANSVVQALNVGDTLTDTFTVTTVDGTPKVVTVTIHGANDAAIISGTAAGSVIEAGGVANAAPGTPTATGTLTDTDVDNTPNTFTAVSSPTASAGGYGTFTMTTAGVWTYTLDDANSAVQALNVGDTLTDTFTVTTVDGTPKVVTVTIHGANDAAIISGTTTGSVIEAGCAKARHADRDRHAHRHRRRQYPQHLHGGQLANGERGRLRHLHDDGGRRVDLHARRSQQRGAGAQCLRHADRHLHGDHHRRHRTGGNGHHPRRQRRSHHFRHHDRLSDRGWRRPCTHGTPTATGTLTDTDVDNTANAFTAVCPPTASDAGYGTFTMTADGVWTYTLDNANCTVQALNVGDTLTDTFTVTTVDGTPQVVTVTIHGTNDAADHLRHHDRLSDRGWRCANARGTPTATGTLTDTDVDNAANTFPAVCSPTASAMRLRHLHDDGGRRVDLHARQRQLPRCRRSMSATR